MLRERLHELIRKRVDFHVTNYRGSHDGEYGRGWITLDGKQVFSCSDFEAMFNEQSLTNEDFSEFDPDGHPMHEYENAQAKKGNFGAKSFQRCLEAYLSMPICDAIKSSYSIHRALALVDSRTGKRALAKIKGAELATPLENRFLELRTEVLA